MTTPRPLAADEIRVGQIVIYLGHSSETERHRVTADNIDLIRYQASNGRITLLEDAPTEDPVQKGLDYMRRYHRNLATPAPESWGNGGPLDAPTEDTVG